MLVIAAVALIVVGPKDLPGMLRQLGRMMGTVRRMGNEFRAEINKAVAVDEITDIRKSISQPLLNARQDIEREFNRIGRDGKVEPTGKIVPKDPKSESVYDEITAAIAPPGKLNGSTPSIAAEAAPPAESKPAKKPSARRTSSKTAPAAKPVETAKAASEKKPSSRSVATPKASKSPSAKPTSSKSAAPKAAAAEPKTPAARKSAAARKSPAAEDPAKAGQ
ncbi:MAG: twin-arginine translocase subunit TatB [Hyphomicrobiaceae bacterium]|nr:twin-arginine translocase subunit TatB [Hyphomicrobiaceae bacterium]